MESSTETPDTPPPAGSSSPEQPDERPTPRPARPRPAARPQRPKLTPRLSFYLTDDERKIDFGRVADDTKDKLRRVLTDPEARRQLGIDPDSQTAAESFKDNPLTAHLVDTVNALLAGFAQTTWKLSDEQAQLILLRRDPKTREQVTALTADLLEKYFPSGFGAYDKEISLLIVLGGFSLDTFKRIRDLAPAPLRVVPRTAVDTND